MPRTRPPYTAEFRAEAVRLYRTSDRGLKQANQLDVDAGRAPGFTTDKDPDVPALGIPWESTPRILSDQG